MQTGSSKVSDELKNDVRSAITALWKYSASRCEGNLADVHGSLHLLVNDTLRPLVEQENRRRPINQLPTELFTLVASFLSLRDLCKTALVCRGWRASLLDCPSLWTRVCISERGPSASPRSSALLHALFTRSQSLPLSIEIRCSIDEEYEEDRRNRGAYPQIAPLIVAEMFRIRSLSLILDLPAVARDAFWAVFSQPAPMLACFRLYVVGESLYMPKSLFSDHAPCLTSLALSMVDFSPFHGCIAVQTVTDFVHDARVICSPDVEAISRLLPALRSLTFFGNDCEIDDLQAVCTLPLAVRLPNLRAILPLMNVFPNATSVCLSSSTEYSDEALRTLFGTVGQPTSMELGYRPIQLVDPKAPDKHAALGTCIKLDGTDVAVDLDNEDVPIAVGMLSTRLQDLRSLTIHENLWELLIPHLAALSSLRELTVHTFLLPQGAHWYASSILSEYKPGTSQPTPVPKLSLTLLRLVAPPEVRAAALPVEESVVADMVRTMFEPDTLRTLVLCGIVLVPPGGPLPALVPHLNILQENSPVAPVSEPWFWKFPADEAFHIF